MSASINHKKTATASNATDRQLKDNRATGNTLTIVLSKDKEQKKKKDDFVLFNSPREREEKNVLDEEQSGHFLCNFFLLSVSLLYREASCDLLPLGKCALHWVDQQSRRWSIALCILLPLLFLRGFTFLLSFFFFFLLFSSSSSFSLPPLCGYHICKWYCSKVSHPHTHTDKILAMNYSWVHFAMKEWHMHVSRNTLHCLLVFYIQFQSEVRDREMSLMKRQEDVERRREEKEEAIIFTYETILSGVRWRGDLV